MTDGELQVEQGENYVDVRYGDSKVASIDITNDGDISVCPVDPANPEDSVTTFRFDTPDEEPN